MVIINKWNDSKWASKILAIDPNSDNKQDTTRLGSVEIEAVGGK
jgi:hypothetical protein